MPREYRDFDESEVHLPGDHHSFCRIFVNEMRIKVLGGLRRDSLTPRQSGASSRCRTHGALGRNATCIFFRSLWAELWTTKARR